jgi:hypothetical protein
MGGSEKTNPQPWLLKLFATTRVDDLFQRLCQAGTGVSNHLAKLTSR